MLLSAVFVQNFEWLHTWYMIKFQRYLDANIVGVERLKFNTKEKKIKRLVVTFVTFYFIAVNILIVSAFIHAKSHPVTKSQPDGQKQPSECEETIVWQFREYINLSGVILSILFFGITLGLFPW